MQTKSNTQKQRKKVHLFLGCVHQVAAPHSVSQVSPSRNGKEFFNPILDLDADVAHRQNITTSQLGQV